VAVVVACMLWPRTAITVGNAAKVHRCMTLAEVEAFLGGPARDESSGIVILAGGPDNSSLNGGSVPVESPFWDGDDIVGCIRTWLSDSAAVWVVFDNADAVADVRHRPTCRLHESPLNRLRRWFGM
jgi:hypothetical protein